MFNCKVVLSYRVSSFQYESSKFELRVRVGCVRFLIIYAVGGILLTFCVSGFGYLIHMQFRKHVNQLLYEVT
jgi:hypothetical protein